MGLFRKTRAEPEATVDETAIDSEPLLSAWLRGEEIGRDKAMQIPTVSGCVDKIARTAANIPIRLYERKDDQVREVRDDPRVELLNGETGDTLDARQMKQAMIRDYYLGKGGYAYVNKRGLEVQSLHYVPCDQVSFSVSPDVIFKDFTILVQGKTYYPHEFIRLLRNTEDGARGHSIVDENSKLLAVAYNSIVFEDTLVSTGGNKKGFVRAQRRLDKKSIDSLKKAWRKLYSNATENVVILNDGLDFKESSSTSVELQLNENKTSNGTEICKIFDVPPSMLTGKSTEMDDKLFLKYCINNILDELTTACNRVLLLESEKKDRFFAADTYELTKGDIEKRYAAYKTATEAGILQIDEIRTMENRPPLGMDYIKLGLQDVLYDPATHMVFTPNTGMSVRLGEQEGVNQAWQTSKSGGTPSSLTDTSTSPDGTADPSRTGAADTSSNASSEEPSSAP